MLRRDLVDIVRLLFVGEDAFQPVSAGSVDAVADCEFALDLAVGGDAPQACRVVRYRFTFGSADGHKVVAGIQEDNLDVAPATTPSSLPPRNVSQHTRSDVPRLKGALR